MSILYCWDHDEERVIEIIAPKALNADVPELAFHKFLVDARSSLRTSRFGMFVGEEEGDQEWIHIPLNAMPKKFRANLLILGIT